MQDFFHQQYGSLFHVGMSTPGLPAFSAELQDMDVDDSRLATTWSNYRESKMEMYNRPRKQRGNRCPILGGANLVGWVEWSRVLLNLFWWFFGRNLTVIFGSKLDLPKRGEKVLSISVIFIGGLIANIIPSAMFLFFNFCSYFVEVQPKDLWLTHDM